MHCGEPLATERRNKTRFLNQTGIVKRPTSYLIAVALIATACATTRSASPPTIAMSAPTAQTTPVVPSTTTATYTSTTITKTSASTTTTIPGTTYELRSSVNLLDAKSQTIDDGWRTHGQAVFDPERSYDDGPGSHLLFGENAMVEGPTVEIAAHHEYTLAVHMWDSGWPPGEVVLFARVVTADGQFIRNLPGSRQVVGAPNEWYEAAVTFVPDTGDAYVRPVVIRLDGPDGVANNLWVDNMFIGKGVGFADPPSPKRPFNGSTVRVDERGRFSVLDGDTWQTIVPICIYADQNNPDLDWGKYADQGFNCNMWAAAAVHVAAAAEVGMRSCFDLSAYALPQGYAYGRLDDMANQIEGIRAAGLMDSLLCYYLDNENAAGADYWDTLTAVVNRVRAIDSGRPIYVLQGNHGLARSYGAAGLTDVVGTYAASTDGAGTLFASHGLLALEQMPGQTSPVTWAQINLGTGDRFPSLVNQAILDGATAIGFWHDTAPGVETLPWWDDLPGLAAWLNPAERRT